MADKTVLDVFSKFDKDSSGSISREELGDVLKALQEEPWEDDEIDNLLTAADSSGDGELQIQEFVKWVFAEDKNISHGLKGKFKLKVSGCSRAEFNGDYTQQEGEFYYRRPVFHCAETNKYLYYHGERKQWQLYWRTGSKSSCRLKTTRAAHMAGEVQWAVWSGKKKAFVRESSMTCTPEATESAEAMLMNAEDCVKFDEIYFKKIDGVVGNRAVYRQSKGDDWGDTYIFFEELESRWKRGDEVKPGQPSLNVSRITDAASPEKAVWMDEAVGGQIDVISVDTDGVPNQMHEGLQFNPKIPEGWKDDDFPHNADSMGVSCTKKYSKPRWLRALALHPHPVLFADVEPADACQGRVGNCWLIAAISALAEFPAYLKGSVFVTRKVSKTGKYAIKLYDGRHYRWRCIEVDDYLPCTYFGAGYTPSLYFGKINNGKLCFALLEKAFAKLYGSYSALRGGYQPVAWHHLTGVKEFFHYQSQYAVSVRWEVSCAGIPVYADRRSMRSLGVMAEGARFFEKQRVGAWIKFQKLSGDGPGEGWLMYYSRGQRLAFRNPSAALRFKAFKVNINPSQIMEAIGGDEGKKGKGARACFTYKWSRYFSPDEMWDQLVSFDKGNYLMACTATYCKDESDCGMVHRHAYSILHAVEIDGFKLVACRNPWGNDKEWNGPWSDRSNEWKYHPKIAKALHVDFQTEGIFWMDWEDWQYIMGQFKAMNCKMPSARGGFHTDFVDEDEDGDGEDGGDFVDEDDEDDVELTGEVVGCEGLCEEWTQPTLMDEGVALKPGESATFKNVPFYLKGKTYFGIKGEASAGMWTIEYVPPVPMYVWLMVGSTNSVELVLPTQGWTQEPAEGFQSSDGYELIVLSYTFTEGKYFSIRCTAPIVGGLVGGHAPPKLPTPGSNEANKAGGDGPAVNLGKVLACSGLDIAWNPPKTMTEGTLTNPGQRNYIFEHVPACLSGGTYIGSQTWPSAGTWTIEYEAPTTLYVWVEKGEYNAGVDDVLGADGWHREEVGDFQRNNCNGGVNPLGLWSRHFDSGSSYSIETTGTFVGGVVSECVDD